MEGLFRDRFLDLSDSHDILYVHLVIDYMLRRTNRRFMDRELASAHTCQISMGLVNRDEYNGAVVNAAEILSALRCGDRPDIYKQGKHNIKNERQELIDLWVSQFGDPKEMERKQAEREARRSYGESQAESLVQQRQAYIRNRLLMK